MMTTTGQTLQRLAREAEVRTPRPRCVTLLPSTLYLCAILCYSHLAVELLCFWFITTPHRGRGGGSFWQAQQWQKGEEIEEREKEQERQERQQTGPQRQEEGPQKVSRRAQAQWGQLDEKDQDLRNNMQSVTTSFLTATHQNPELHCDIVMVHHVYI
jgi:hypothetical protein